VGKSIVACAKEKEIVVKRSTINQLIRDSQSFLEDLQFRLPPFAFWPTVEWSTKGPESAEIVSHRLGWDVTDFGQGDFEHKGLTMFTIRNGSAESLKLGRGKLYAEKVLIVDRDQVTPFHFHWSKTEDIINRGGGDLIVRLYNADHLEELDNDDVLARVDGTQLTVEAGGTVCLRPGQSITLTPRVYHAFWGSGSRVVVGEVSTVNNDYTDNRFLEPLGRFPDVEEDVEPQFLLVNDYERYAPKLVGMSS
jgi:D-lyxose ketol-isomerase